MSYVAICCHLYLLPIYYYMPKEKMIPLKKFAEANQIGYRTAYRHWQNGLLEGIKLPTGTILVSGWKTSNEKNANSCIVLLRSTQEDASAELKSLIAHAKSLDLEVQDAIVWKGYSFQTNIYIEDILKKGISYIVTNKMSEIYGVNYELINKLLEQNGINTIAIEESSDIELSIKGLINASSRMAKAAVGMHTHKRDIAHYVQQLLK